MSPEFSAGVLLQFRLGFLFYDVNCLKHVMNRIFANFHLLNNILDTVKTEKFCVTLLYKKAALTMLLKMTPNCFSCFKVRLS